MLQNMSAQSISHLHETMLFFFSARDRLYVTRDPRSRNQPSTGPSQAPRLLVENRAFISGEVLSSTRVAIKDVLYYAGGVSSIVYLVGTAHVRRLSPLSFEFLEFLRIGLLSPRPIKSIP